jgi:hypothetical protein
MRLWTHGLAAIIGACVLIGCSNSSSSPTAPSGSSGSRIRTGATCSDGTGSSATGSGACSSHGGVRCWQYNDGTCTNP